MLELWHEASTLSLYQLDMRECWVSRWVFNKTFPVISQLAVRSEFHQLEKIGPHGAESIFKLQVRRTKYLRCIND